MKEKKISIKIDADSAEGKYLIKKIKKNFDERFFKEYLPLDKYNIENKILENKLNVVFNFQFYKKVNNRMKKLDKLEILKIKKYETKH